jgi:hypothetical protein
MKPTKLSSHTGLLFLNHSKLFRICLVNVETEKRVISKHLAMDFEKKRPIALVQQSIAQNPAIVFPSIGSDTYTRDEESISQIATVCVATSQAAENENLLKESNPCSISDVRRTIIFFESCMNITIVSDTIDIDFITRQVTQFLDFDIPAQMKEPMASTTLRACEQNIESGG